MAYRKQVWVDYGRYGEIIEFIIRDRSGAKIEMFKCNNNKDFNQVIRAIHSKYSQFKFEPTIKPEESVNELQKKPKEEIEDDKNDFLKSDFTW